MRKMLISLMALTKDQRNLTGKNLENIYIRKWEKRFEFDHTRGNLSMMPSNIPFELFIFWRHFYLE